MTNSAGESGLIISGKPPNFITASRIAAKSTIAGTPVKSCSITLAGEKEISVSDWPEASQLDRASISFFVTSIPFSFLRRFSRSIL